MQQGAETVPLYLEQPVGSRGRGTGCSINRKGTDLYAKETNPASFQATIALALGGLFTLGFALRRGVAIVRNSCSSGVNFRPSRCSIFSTSSPWIMPLPGRIERCTIEGFRCRGVRDSEMRRCDCCSYGEIAEALGRTKSDIYRVCMTLGCQPDGAASPINLRTAGHHLRRASGG